MAAAPSLTPRRRRLVLAVVALSLVMVVSAVSGLNVALPDLARDTGASQSQLQWVVDAYAVVFAGLLLPAGAIGDRFGRREALLAGLALFGAAAAAALLVEDPAALIALRAVMGAGAALVMPTTLSIITTSFPPQERGAAVGVWVGMAGGGAVLGLLGAGVLLELFSWSSFFALNVVLAALAAAGALAFVPSSRAADPAPFDAGGALLSVAGVSALVFGVIEGPERGWADPLVAVTLAGGGLALLAFVAWELQRERPLLDPRLFALRGFRAGTISLTAQFFAAFGFFFVILQHLQFVAGLSPLGAALALLPMPLVMVPLARRVPAIAARFGAGRVAAAGLALIGAGLGLLSALGPELDRALLSAGIVVFAAGMGLAGPPATTAIVSALPRAQQGVASAVNDVSRELGAALGIAVLGSVLNGRYRAAVEPAVAGLPDAVAEGAASSIAAAQAAGGAAPWLAAAAERAFVDGMGAALLVAAAVALVAAVVVAVLAPRTGDAPRGAAEQGAAPAAA